MNRSSALATSLVAAVAVSALNAPPAQAAPSCVAQSIRAEHATYGTSWGKDLIAWLAVHPEALQEFGFASLGDLVRYSAAQPSDACPPDL
jgi:hypothetical protein